MWILWCGPESTPFMTPSCPSFSCCPRGFTLSWVCLTLQPTPLMYLEFSHTSVVRTSNVARVCVGFGGLTVGTYLVSLAGASLSGQDLNRFHMLSSQSARLMVHTVATFNSIKVRSNQLSCCTVFLIWTVIKGLSLCWNTLWAGLLLIGLRNILKHPLQMPRVMK